MRLLGLAVLTVLFFLTGCVSASKSLQKGRYDDAIAKCIKILHKEPSNEKHLDILKTAYRLADLNDDERIVSLKKSGQPDIWEQVVKLYEKRSSRNLKMEALPSSVKNTLGFSYESYADDLAVAKQKAADYYYALGVQQLNSGLRFEARNAYANFEKVISFAGITYKDVDARRNKAKQLGTVYVLYKVDNRSGGYLPQEAVYNLGDIRPEFLNSFWVKYEVGSQHSTYQYEVTFTLSRHQILPTTVKTRQFSNSKIITDGTEYLTDSKGKPVLDSAGNFIKVPKKIQLSCNVVEVIQQKGVRLDGDLSYYDVVNKRWMRTFPLTREFMVYSSTYDVKGDLRALSDENKKLLNAPRVPLPTDEALLILATQSLSESIRRTMSDYAGVLTK